MSSVATVPTVYGIETLYNFLMCDFALPVATVPTVYGIETTELELHWSNSSCNSTYRLRYWNRLKSFYKPRLYEMRCNSTYRLRYWNVIILAISTISDAIFVATVPTVYGIETSIFLQQERHRIFQCCNSTYRLRYWNGVSKQLDYLEDKVSCNSTYRLRYWNHQLLADKYKPSFEGCNSTYRLRYWNKFIPFPLTMTEVATVPTVYGIET